jgi:hypothetical protein
VTSVTARPGATTYLGGINFPNGNTGAAAMTAITAPKPLQANRLEGFVLTALFQGFPTFAAAALLLKLTGSHEIVGTRYGAAIFVVLAALFYAVLTPSLGRKFPNRFKHGYEPLFFDATLSLAKRSRAGAPSR